MRFIFHILGILFFLIWITIGAAIVVGLILLFTIKPWQARAGGNAGGVVSSLMGSNMLSGILPKLNPKDLSEGIKSLPKTQQDCLSKELGSKTIDDALAGKLQPTPDLILKAMKCLK